MTKAQIDKHTFSASEVREMLGEMYNTVYSPKDSPYNTCKNITKHIMERSIRKKLI